MKIGGIIFDLDGTLVHTIEDIAGAANAMFTRYGLPTHGVDYYLRWIGSGAVKFIERALDREVEQELLMRYVADFKEIYGNNLHDRSCLYDGIPGVLDEIADKGIKLSVLSNKPHALTREVAAYYLSAWPFDPILGQRDEVPRKPDPAAAFEIAEHMGLQPEEILFVGDSDNDIFTARAAGMVPLAVSWGYGRLEEEPVDGEFTTIDHPSEIRGILGWQ